MVFEKVSPRRLADDVFDQIVEGVLSGDLPVGERLPSERDLAERLGVSRPAVREALQRVAASGIVTIRQGEGARVHDPATSGGLDLLSRLLIRNGAVVPTVARSIIETRALIGPSVAGLAARRVDAAGLARIEQSLAELADQPDPVAQQIAAIEFWSRVIDAADSITFRLMYNSLRVAYEPAVSVLASALEPEVGNIDGYRAVVAALAAHDPAAAEDAARALLAPATQTLLAVCEALIDDPESPTEEDER